MINLETKIEQLPKTGIKQAGKLRKLGIEKISDLIFHFPFRYDDYSQIENISKIYQGQATTIAGKIISANTSRTWKKRMAVTEILIRDGSGTIRAVWFNQPYLRDSLTAGKQIRLSGKVSSDANGLFFSNPAWEMAAREPTHTGRLVPVYPETEGLTSRWLRWQIQMVFKSGFQIADPVPAAITKKLNIPPLEKALKFIHFPKTKNEYLIARKRFAFEEMLLIQLKYLQIKSSWKNESSIKIKFDEKLIKNFVSSLPFQLTGAQKKSSWQILQDMGKPRPMNRLLNGDVGSGKTIVAALATLQTAENKYQTVIMAPTEILARQHFEEFCKLFANYNFKIALLTSSYKITNKNHDPNSKIKTAKPAKFSSLKNSEIENSLKIRKLKIENFNSHTNYKTIKREELLDNLQTGKFDILIGTHAVIQKDVRFKNLALIIVDEQHRFGVAQRAYLQQKTSEINDGIKNKAPHFLTMTATPIPRTLTMAFFGNLDISFLDEMPKNRKKIITKTVPSRDRTKIYEFVRAEIKKGRQAFVILPLIEESGAMAEVKAAVSEHKRLSEIIFPEFKVGLLHGRIKPKEKEKIMRDFQNKKCDILVSTSVVEVGIDIPNATVMLIEDADRFGLSQLHQFRGRVGRGKFQSYCFLFAEKSCQRLKILEKNSDGFKVAEKDLAIRGPGDFLGTRQSGLPDIAMENIANAKLIQISKEETRKLLASDPRLARYPLLRTALAKFEEKIHLE
ncbi:ATP-dependent DNA helicase RecG [bacterium]|nr:ATP-dependent DNA helicase RecG [bacterium]